MTHPTLSRRRFLTTTAGVFASAGFASRLLRGGERPPVTIPRATSGDDRHEPDWNEKLTLTVGPKRADLVGNDDKVLQAAVDYVARLGGGTVHVQPGTYTLRNAIYLASNVRILGSGEDSIVTKIPSETVALSEDSDWYDREITLENGKAFRVGDGIVLQAKNPHDGGTTVLKRTLVARDGNRFKLDRPLRKNLWLSGKPTASSLFPLLTSEYTADVVIEKVTLDGNKEKNANLNGNYGGCIFLQDCNRYTIREVEARNYDGDGISFQICHDVVVEHCHSHDNTNLGLHPGSGSQRPLLRHNRLERNDLGLFWCWGVKFGLAEHNRIDANRRYGISIGHNDTDNVMRHNVVTNSGQVGILFRDDSRGKDFWANRNVVEHNRIENSGGEDGVAIDVTGKTRDIRLAHNEIRETRSPADRIGIRIGADAGTVTLAENTFSGFATDVLDLRKS